eukprot:25972-Chlamydomonas_euryale.AAC.1
MRPKGDRHANALGCALHAKSSGGDAQLSRLELKLVHSVPVALTSSCICRVTTNSSAGHQKFQGGQSGCHSVTQRQDP